MSICATPEELERSKELQLEAQSRAAIKAWCDDPSAEIEACIKEQPDDWWMLNKENKGLFNTLDCYYRIAKPKKWYRVAKMQDVLDTEPYTLQATSEGDEENLENDREFVEWLDERKYYD